MTFDDVWNDGAVDTFYKVDNGTPPPSTNLEGGPYAEWRSHNFIGSLEAKVERGGWRYLKFELPNDDTHDTVLYLAYEIADKSGHNFEVQ